MSRLAKSNSGWIILLNDLKSFLQENAHFYLTIFQVETYQSEELKERK